MKDGSHNQVSSDVFIYKNSRDMDYSIEYLVEKFLF